MNGINSENYQQLAENTSATKDFNKCKSIRDKLWAQDIRLLHGLMGLCTETGEIQDQMKRYLFYNTPLDFTNLAEECGDILWYVAEILNALDVSIESVMTKNIEKLRVRFPDKFSDEKAVNRNLEKEYEVLNDTDS